MKSLVTMRVVSLAKRAIRGGASVEGGGGRNWRRHHIRQLHLRQAGQLACPRHLPCGRHAISLIIQA